MGFYTTKCRPFLLSAGRRWCLGGTEWCSITPSMSHATFTAHCVGRGEPGCFHSFDWRFMFGSYEWAQVSSITLVPPRRPVRLHSGASVAPRKFHGVSNVLQVCGNSECGAQYCDILRLLLLTHAQSIGYHHPTGKQGVELCCFPHGVILYDISGFPKCFNQLCPSAIWQCCIATYFTESLKTFLCTTNSCHFNFEPGTLL